MLRGGWRGSVEILLLPVHLLSCDVCLAAFFCHCLHVSYKSNFPLITPACSAASWSSSKLRLDKFRFPDRIFYSSIHLSFLKNNLVDCQILHKCVLLQLQ